MGLLAPNPRQESATPAPAELAGAARLDLPGPDHVNCYEPWDRCKKLGWTELGGCVGQGKRLDAIELCNRALGEYYF